MDWQAAATELLALILTDRTFAPGFDWQGEWPKLIDEAREQAGTNVRVEAARLRGILAQRDAAFAAEQRLRDLGANEQDINTLRTAK